MRTLTRLALVGALCTTALVVPAFAADAVGQGTFTEITTPAHTVTHGFKTGGTNTLQVSGVTSLDVTEVDIDCVLYIVGTTNQVSHFASAVPVSGGSFSVTAGFPSTPPTNCRLRAVPAGVDATTDYLGAYTGPILYTNAFGTSKDGGGKVYSFTAQSEEGDGVAVITDAGSCGTEAIVTVEAPQMIAGPVMLTCLFSLPSGDIDPSGSSQHSAIRVNGHNAYLPAGVHGFLIGSRGLSLTQPVLTVSRSVAGNGDGTITESALLMRCSTSDVYPPTNVSCPSLVSTGVRFQRVTTFWRNGHQARIRDTFTSVDHAAHTVTMQYLGAAENETAGGTSTGNVGYSFPGHSNTFQAVGLGRTLSGFGNKAGSLLIRSDLHARTDDPQADTMAGTWSKPPSKIVFDSSAHDQFGMSFSVAVPAGGKGFLGFGSSERWQTTDAKQLAALAVRDMTRPPSITSPHNGATINGTSTTVKGKLRAGANGLPTSVKVNGHRATVTRTSATTATYKVKFSESLGTHRLAVVAKDVVGNAASASIKVKNA
jgi:hypothetical protein